METLEKEDVYRIAREVARQEIEAVLPIHSEIVDLKSAVKELVQAQARTEARLEELAQAQARTELRLEELAQAQAKTEARLEELAQAQARTEQAQARTEARLEELAQAQAKTEEELRSLAVLFKDMQREMRSISQQLGGLAHAVGFQLEDRAYVSLPRLLELDFGVKVKERLLRRFIKTKKGENLEINIIGKGERDGKEVYIIGEAKANLSIRHIVDFLDRLDDIRETLQTEIIPIIVTYMTEPEVEEFAKSKGIKVYYSYDFQPIF